MLRPVQRREQPAMRSLADAWMDEWPRAKAVAMEVEAEARLLAQPWGRLWTRAEAKAHVAAEARAPAWVWAKREVRIRASRTSQADLWRMMEDEEAEMWSETEMETLPETKTLRGVEVEALVLAGVWGWARSEVRTTGTNVPFVLGDMSTIALILTSLNDYGIAHHLWHRSPETRDDYLCIIHFIAPITRLPFELLHQILLTIIDEASGSPLGLMLVCKHWHAVVTSIWASLNLGTRSPIDAVTSKLERSRWLLDIVVDTDFDRGGFTAEEGAYEAIFAVMEASSRWRSFIVESFPARSELSEEVVNRCLERGSHTTMNRFTTLKIKSACETSPLLDGLLYILGTGTMTNVGPTTVEINSPNIVACLTSTYPSIFHSVKVLSLNTPGIPNPVDLLPHLHRLESFTASNISFPSYHNDVEFPFIHTLRRLILKAVSVQWMNGRTFHVLDHCTLIFPLHHHVPTFRATLPTCKHLTFQGFPLNILNRISAHNLAHLSVTCSRSSNGRGDRQLALISQVFRKGQCAPNVLNIGIEATNQAWVNALSFMPGLEELVIHSAQPSSLGAKVFESLVLQQVNLDNSSTISTPGQLGTQLCPLLQRFGLKYDRWLQPTEQFDLIPVFMSVIRSRQSSLKSFSLSMRRDQKDPLELVGRSGVNANGFIHLANESGIEDSSLNFRFWEFHQASHIAHCCLPFTSLSFQSPPQELELTEERQ